MSRIIARLLFLSENALGLLHNGKTGVSTGTKSHCKFRILIYVEVEIDQLDRE